LTGARVSDHRDARKGLAVERTALAWNRSGLAVVAIGAVLARAAAEAGHAVAGVICAAVLALAGGGVWAFGVFAYSNRRRGQSLDASRQRTALRLISAVTVLCAALAFVLALLT
jgi:uncharacterized membrane protein YidH (DUF202 family)